RALVRRHRKARDGHMAVCEVEFQVFVVFVFVVVEVRGVSAIGCPTGLARDGSVGMAIRPRGGQGGFGGGGGCGGDGCGAGEGCCCCMAWLVSARPEPASAP